MEKDEQIIKEQLECIAENLSRYVSNRMTREEMITKLEETCHDIDDCTVCPMSIFGVRCNTFASLSDDALEERMAILEAENRLHHAEEQLGFKFNMPQCDEVAKLIDERRDQEAKADAGKAPISLVPMEIVWAIAWIRKYGNEKYGDPNNWKTVEPERYRDALMRHILHYISDPRSVDEESGYPHLWHAACNMAFLMNMDYGDMCHYDFAVKKPEWEKIGKDAVENSRFSPSEVMHDVNDRLGKEIGKVIDEAD